MRSKFYRNLSILMSAALLASGAQGLCASAEENPAVTIESDDTMNTEGQEDLTQPSDSLEPTEPSGSDETNNPEDPSLPSDSDAPMDPSDQEDSDEPSDIVESDDANEATDPSDTTEASEVEEGGEELQAEAEEETELQGEELHEGFYMIKNSLDENMVLDVQSAMTDNGANIWLYNQNNTLAQQFEVIHVEDDYYKIKAEHSEKVMTADITEDDETANVYQSAWVEADTQLWKFVDSGEGTFYICSKTGKSLEIDGEEAQAKTNVQTEQFVEGEAQKWVVTEIEESLLRPVEDGTYVIRNSASQGKSLTQVSSKIQLKLFENISEQKFNVQYISDGYYKITDTGTGKVLDVHNASVDVGASLQVYRSNDTDAQRWRIVSAGNGAYYIKSKLGTFVMPKSASTSEGVTVQMDSYRSATTAQRWEFDSKAVNTSARPFEDGTYVIGTKLSGSKVLDLSGASVANKGNIQIYTSNNTPAQRVELTYTSNGYYKILIEKSGKALDISGASKSNGANVQQYDWNGTSAQLWKFIPVGDGSYYIKSKLGTVLDVKNANSANKTNVQAYAANETNAQKWTLKRTSVKPVKNGTYMFTSKLSIAKVADVSGASKGNKANVHLYAANGTNAQKFKVEHVKDGFYKIINVNSGKALDVSGASTANGANVQQYQWNGTDAQLWKFVDAGNGTYYIRSKLGKTLDVKSGKTANKTNIQLYGMNGTNAQKWTVGTNNLMAKINQIKKYIYVPYVSGGATTRGWDCSGFTQWALKYLGVSIPRTAAQQAKGGTYVNHKDMSKWQPGDVLIYSSGGRVSHVALYLGDGQLMHSLNEKYDTLIQSVAYYERWDGGTYLSGVRRYL